MTICGRTSAVFWERPSGVDLPRGHVCSSASCRSLIGNESELDVADAASSKLVGGARTSPVRRHVAARASRVRSGN